LRNVSKSTLYVDTQRKSVELHTLIYKMYVGEMPKNYRVCYIDNNCHNLNANNLRLEKVKVRKCIEFIETDEWKNIPEYEGRYIANRDGEIKSLASNKILEAAQIGDNTLYERVNLTNIDGLLKKHDVHRLIFLAFNKTITVGKVIDHIDRNKSNNKLSNLREATRSENAKNVNKKERIIYNVECLCDEFVTIDLKYKDHDFSDYSCNEYGQVKGLTGKIMQGSCRKGYHNYLLKDKYDEKQIGVQAHVLVATIFMPNMDKMLDVVNHIDKNRSNNHKSNLEWTTSKINTRHSCAKKIEQYNLDNTYIKTYDCVQDVYSDLGKIYNGNVIGVANGKRNNAYGYIWKWPTK
jgi:hypothetical protein